MNLRVDQFSSPHTGFCRMLLSRNTWALLGALVLVLASAGASAQEDGAPEVSWADGEEAFGWVHKWVRDEAGVPEDADLPSRPVGALFGVYVTLRQDGRVLGRGQALREKVADTVDQAGPAVELAPLVAAATRQALSELRDKLMKDAVERNINDPQVFKDRLLATRQRVQVDIQLGHNLESVVLPIDSGVKAVFDTFAHGYHGLRLIGPLTESADYAWPATELAKNTSPPRLLFRLLDQQGYEPDDMPLIARADGPALQRFDIIHVVRPASAQPMRRLIRGNLILKQQVIDDRTIAGLAERSARYLDQLIAIDTTTGQLAVRGTYRPSLERYAPEISNGREAALLCYAINRHARISLDAGQAGESTRARAERVTRLIEQLDPIARPHNKPVKHLTAAFLLLALCESPVISEPSQFALRDRLGAALLDLHHPEGGGYRIKADSEKRLSRASAAVITYALASWFEVTRNRQYAKPVWSVLGELMKENADDPRVIDLLWVQHALATAGERLASVQPEPREAADQLKAWQAQLAKQLDRLSEQQIRVKPLLGPEDVLGGFILTKAVPGSPPNPTWQSAMPLAFIAIGLREPAVVPEDKVFGPLLTASLGARFIGQLMISEPAAYYIRDPAPALGGVRNNLWDNSLYPDCSAMALIALAELQQSLIVLDKE